MLNEDCYIASKPGMHSSKSWIVLEELTRGHAVATSSHVQLIPARKLLLICQDSACKMLQMLVRELHLYCGTYYICYGSGKSMDPLSLRCCSATRSCRSKYYLYFCICSACTSFGELAAENAGFELAATNQLQFHQLQRQMWLAPSQ